MKKISIGGGQGFWGDSPDAAIHMIRHAELDYMACDYLAELTLSIMQRQKMKNPAAGYARDFIGLMKEIGKEAYEKKVGIITRLTFSIPPEMPNSSTRTVMNTTARCHGRLPKWPVT